MEMGSSVQDAGKLPYVAPRLVVYGSLALLTRRGPKGPGVTDGNGQASGKAVGGTDGHGSLGGGYS